MKSYRYLWMGKVGVLPYRFLYQGTNETRRAHDPYDKIRFGEGRQPYKKHMLFDEFAMFPIKTTRLLIMSGSYTQVLTLTT